MARISFKPFLVALAALGVWAAQPAKAAEPLVIRLGYAGVGADNRQFASGNTWATAHAGGFLEEEFKNDPNIKLEWYFFRGAGPAVNEALANKQLDFASQGDLPSIIGRSNGLKTKLLLVGGTRRPVYLAVPKGSPIKTIEDLKGRKVALQLGTNNHLSAAKVLAAHGLSDKTVSIINLDASSANAALASKDVDAAFGDTSFLRLKEQGLVEIAYNSNDDNPIFSRTGSTFVTEDFEKAHPDITARVVKAFVKAAQWSSEEQNREALIALWAKSGTPESILRADLAPDPLAFRHSPLIDPFIIGQYRTRAAQSKEFGLVRRDVSVDAWFEPKYLDAALKELGLTNYWTRYADDGKALVN
ncbi:MULTISPECIES: ABC transporter substrate-binding protein [unclassified Chelatococcus]|uniref:ABC transporter substrate-binding protein n=1 Tax=unclassified Chelatococcus TaxID=2638111 RepID=UPI001BCE9CB8|nr:MULTISPECIES: ABC transporter substrate-binding protein [unclassified Chelatococcus]CAH1650200.1 Alkanesulfonates-binding protein [Hyphomicrobiales bacterium]MBS7743338.1 ABC transporter substrate-binding protein [Chelatococcus sp. HY11]MBX3541544.1 ABC transporter substrate-binding protein [Chelatococcus sp.]MCO5074564.1 ABC transporter substrate-binding protein [Chelatococcus sp.]CAH1692493.1 Alkanesulfonates-binding protein [Hyphomicrobiales bacterium]